MKSEPENLVRSKIDEVGMYDPTFKRKKNLASLFDKPDLVKGEDEKDPLEKWTISDNVRGNRLHDETTGRFTSSDSVNIAPGGGFSFETNSKPAPKTTNTGLGFSFDDTSVAPAFSAPQDTQAVPEDFRELYVNSFNHTAAKFGLQSVRTVAFKALRSGSIAQTSTYVGVGGDNTPFLYNDIAIDYQQLLRVRASWDEDQSKILMGRTPFNSCSYAKSRDTAHNGVGIHEAAHVMMAEYVVKQDKNEWADPKDPTQGTTGWKSTVTTAASSGWQPPSTYAKSNLAEMFAESVTMKELKGTTKNKDVDQFIDGVIASESRNSNGNY